MKEIDYPAGHSVDSDWFAVDKDGNVGFFKTSAEGSVPFETEKLYFLEILEKYTEKLTDCLHKLYIDGSSIDEILKHCDKKCLDESIAFSNRGDVLYFEGFILLKEGYTWDDLELEKDYPADEDFFALSVSETIPLYLIDGWYCAKEKFIKAVEDGIIISGAYIDMCGEWDRDCFGFSIDILGAFRYESQDYVYPYKREFIPNVSLHISQFNKQAQEAAAHFDSFLFSDMNYIQPLEFKACDVWSTDSLSNFSTHWKEKEKGYVNIILSDNESEGLCSVYSSVVKDKISSLWQCNTCNLVHMDKTIRNITYLETGFPSIMLLLHHKDIDLSLFNKVFGTSTGKSLKEIYKTFCIKCYTEETPIYKGEIEDRVTKCFTHLEYEYSKLQPNLIIAIGNDVFNSLKSNCKISVDAFVSGCLCDITIEKKTCKLLLFDIPNNENINDIESILTKLAPTITETVNTSRDIDNMPQVIKREE